MKTITIDQQYNVETKITYVDCYYKNKRILWDVLESNEGLDLVFIRCRQLGFTHWKSKNGMINNRKL